MEYFQRPEIGRGLQRSVRTLIFRAISLQNLRKNTRTFDGQLSQLTTHKNPTLTISKLQSARERSWDVIPMLNGSFGRRI